MSATRISLLGRLSIDREDHAAAPRGLPGRRAELVFAYLAAEHHRSVSRDELADALWPGLLPDTWASAVRGVVTEVRRFIEEAGFDPAEVLVATGGGYQLRLPEGVVVDVDEARAALAAAREELAARGLPAAVAHAERAAALARLPFLPQHEGDWVDGLRSELGSIHVSALELQVRARAEAGDPRSAATAAERLVQAEPFSEAAHQLRIRVLGEAGDRAGAVAAYEACRKVLASELGVEPSAETESVLRRGARARARASRADGARRILGAGRRGSRLPAPHRGAAAARAGRRHDRGGRRRRMRRSRSIDGSGPPDVIVVDLDMPGMDGVELIRHVGERDIATAVIISSRLDPKLVHAVEALTESYGLDLLGAIEKPLTARRLAELLAAHRREPAGGSGDDRSSTVTAADVAEALDDKRVVVRFRPMVDLATGSVSGAALVPGWRDHDGGWIAPAFLPVLEAEGLVSRFTDHVLDLACVGLRDLARRGLDLDATIGVPGRCFDDVGLADRFAEIIRERGVDPRRIVCGVGERVLRRDASALLVLTRLRLKGFGVCVEDFGTAHTSAEHIQRFPLTAIEVAAGLVTGAAGDARRVTALEEALDLARGLDLVVGAGGCDSAADFDLLLRLGCGYATGALVGDPMSVDELVAWDGRWTPPSSVVGSP